MSLFRSNDFSPLFRLLDDYDHHRTARQQPTLRTFNPRFDVRESNDSYHLDGELPGIAQKDIDIEFSDPQTLVVKGRTERSYNTDSQDQAEEEDTSDAASDSTKSKKVAKTDSKSSPKSTYWASERVVGEFQRTFSFGQRVDQDAVKASLKNGILSITVPKAAAATSKKITIE
jgi:HSP20 family molecular chaperone IbpA